MKPIQQWSAQEIIDFLKKVDKKTWIKVGLGVLAVIGTLIFIVWPAWFQRLEIRTKIKTIESQVKTLETLNKKKPEWLKNKSGYEKFIREVKQRIFMPGESSLLLGAISKIANESNVSIVASQPKEFNEKFPSPFDEQYEASLYDFVVEGSYHDLGNFAGRIESNPKILRFQRFHLKPNETNNKKHIGELSLSAVSFKKPK